MGRGGKERKGEGGRRGRGGEGRKGEKRRGGKEGKGAESIYGRNVEEY